MKYKYFVSYNFLDGSNNGFANCVSRVDFKILDIEAINRISNSIKRDCGHDVVVINNFILLGTEE